MDDGGCRRLIENLRSARNLRTMMACCWCRRVGCSNDARFSKSLSCLSKLRVGTAIEVLLMGTVEQRWQSAEAALTIGFEKYTLTNGLEVILSEDHRLPVVAVNIWYHVGPANERPGRTGFAHLFEHMMFQGSKHVGENQIKVLQAAGATAINGTTGFDRTNYFETMPAERVELALWLESDRMAFLSEGLTARNLANQRDVVRNERRQRENTPYSLVWEELYRQLFPAGHPYHATIIGSHADIESARLDDMKEFCRQYYVPNNASLALV